VYFGGDEAHFAVIARALGETGANLKGERLPVFVSLSDPIDATRQPWGETWYQPFLFYWMALFLSILPMSEAAARLPAALIGGVITPLLMFAVTRRLTGHAGAAMVGAAVIAVAPVHVILSRQALDYVCPLPFVLGWLWCLHSFAQTANPRWAALAGVVLGLGCYSYIASWAMMPLYLVVSWLVFWRLDSRRLTAVWISGAAFALMMLPAILWVPQHWDMAEQTFARYGLVEQPRAGVLETYISFFDPVMLFLRGGPSLTTSTARSGALLLPVAVLAAAGLWALVRRRYLPAWARWVIVIGILTAPIPAAVKGEPLMIQRALYILPFAGVLAALGFLTLRTARHATVRASVWLLVVAMPVQFGLFFHDYFTHYKFRSAFYYDPVAFRDVAEYVIADARFPALYLTTDLDDGRVKWRFYTTRAGRPDLVGRTTFVAPDLVPAAPAGSLLVTYPDQRRLDTLAGAGWTVENIIHDVDNRPAAAILRRGR
jgi:4-amino-4-deoxy-L-arabinose transferase-like glycosyltransferase